MGAIRLSRHIRARIAAPAEWPTAMTGRASSASSSPPSACAIPGSDRPRRRRQRGEAVAGEIGGDHRELLCQQRRKVTPRVGGRTRAVHQQEHRAGAHLLHMPFEAASTDEAAGLSIRPVRAVLVAKPAGRHRPRLRGARAVASRSGPRSRGGRAGRCQGADRPRQRRRVGERQGQVACVHGVGELARRGLRSRGRVDEQRGEPGAMDETCGRERVLLRLRPAGRPVAGDVGATVGQKDQDRRLVLAADRVGQGRGRVERGRQRRATTPGQAGEAALGADQRAGRRQQKFRLLATKGQQRHAITAHVAVGQQQLDGTLRLGQPVQRRRARGVDDKDGRGPRALPEPRHPKIVATHLDPGGLIAGLAVAQRLPGGRGAQASRPRSAARRPAARPGEPRSAGPWSRTAAGHPPVRRSARPSGDPRRAAAAPGGWPAWRPAPRPAPDRPEASRPASTAPPLHGNRRTGPDPLPASRHRPARAPPAARQPAGRGHAAPAPAGRPRLHRPRRPRAARQVRPPRGRPASPATVP